MSEHPGLEFAPQSSRSAILPSMPSLVLFIISMAMTLTNTLSTVYDILLHHMRNSIENNLVHTELYIRYH